MGSTIGPGWAASPYPSAAGGEEQASSEPRTYLTGQEVPRAGTYVCNMCGTRQHLGSGAIFGPCRVCGEHANAWTKAQDADVGPNREE